MVTLLSSSSAVPDCWPGRLPMHSGSQCHSENFVNDHSARHPESVTIVTGWGDNQPASCANFLQRSWPISHYLIRALSSARTVGEYYDPARMPVGIVFFGDFIYSTFILLVAQQVIARTVGVGSWLAALGVFLGVQWVSDFLFYVFVSGLPRGTSRYVDFFQRYTREVGVGALVGDSLYGVVWLAASQAALSGVPVWGQLVAIVLFLFGTLMVSY